MAYRYGGGMDPRTKKRIAKAVLCSVLALSVFSGMSSAFAWHFIPWIYHLPTADNSGVQDKFDWNKVKGTVSNGLKNLAEKERYNPYKTDPQDEYNRPYNYSPGEYLTEDWYSKDGRDYYWHSYYWEWDGENYVKRTISYFDFDTIGGTIATWRRYGAGDWVKEPTGWGYGDDFAMYSSLFDSNIPIRDNEVRSNWNDMNQRQLDGEETSVIPVLRTIAETEQSREKSNVKKGGLGYDLQVAFSLKGNLKDLIGKIRDPKQLLQGVQVVIKDKQTPVNPDVPVSGGFGRGYNREEVEDGTPIIKDKEKYLEDTYADSAEAYKKAMEDLETTRQQLEQLTKTETQENGNEGEESPVSAKQREEQIKRLQFSLKQQQEVVDTIEAKRQATSAVVAQDIQTIKDRQIKDQAHMPTTKEIVKEMREKREKYSTSRDLGYRKFGQKKKANFGSILDNAINPKLEEQDKDKE